MVIIFKSILPGSGSLTLMTFLLWMEKPFRANEQKQDHLLLAEEVTLRSRPTLGGELYSACFSTARRVGLAGYTASAFRDETRVQKTL